MRHAKAEPGFPDEERGLSAVGRREAEAVTRWLKEVADHVGRIEHSPLRRARETAERMATGLGCSLRETADLKPGGNVAGLAERLAKETEENLILIGHNPMIERLANLLLSGYDSDHPLLSFHTASTARLVPFDNTTYTCDWIVKPSIL